MACFSGSSHKEYIQTGRRYVRTLYVTQGSSYQSAHRQNVIVRNFYPEDFATSTYKFVDRTSFHDGCTAGLGIFYFDSAVGVASQSQG